jgi:very-short-patch-repair endonuclease
MSDKCASADLVAAAIAERQHGVVSLGQLNVAGLDKHAVLHRARTGRLRRLHQGVYAVGHGALHPEARWMAAVLACGGGPRTSPGRSRGILDCWGAALSHRSAAALWELLPPGGGSVDVSVPGDGGRRRREGIRLHRSLSLLPADVTLRRGIPVTNPARTILDLRRAAGRQSAVAPAALRRAIRQAGVLGFPIGGEAARDRTRSDLERDFLRLCGRYGLPKPEVNVRVGRHLVDFLWRGRMLVVETDGYRYHRGRAAFEDDRARGLDLRARGFEVIRLAEKQVEAEPRRVAEVVGAALRVRADGR